MLQGPKQVYGNNLQQYKLTFCHTNGVIEYPVTTKTASYTVLLSDSGHIFTTHGATGAVVFTLPVTLKKGFYALFVNAVAQDMTITAGTEDTLITFNDAAADSVAVSTGSAEIGGAVLVFCDGNAFYAIGITVGVTYTVGT